MDAERQDGFSPEAVLSLSRCKMPGMKTRGLPLPRRSWRRIAALACIVVGAAALGYTLWFWRQWTRPGMTHYLRGMEHLSAKRYAEAEREWLRGVREDPTAPQCYERLGDLYAVALRYDEAAANFAAAAKLAPADGSLFVRLAHAEQLAGRDPEALEAARRAALLLPDDASAVGEYGLLAKKAYRRGDALAALRRAHTLRPDDPRFFIGMVNLQMDAGETAEAERALAGWLAKRPDDRQACFLMAHIYNLKPRTPEHIERALQYVRRALPGMRREGRAYGLMGQLYLDSGRPRAALRAYLDARRVAPGSESVLSGLARCYGRLGDAGQAARFAREAEKASARHDRIEHLRHTMGFNHFDIPAGLELARLNEEDGNIGMARAYYEQIVRQSPRDPRTRPALAAFYKRQGRIERAQRALRPDFLP